MSVGGKLAGPALACSKRNTQKSEAVRGIWGAFLTIKAIMPLCLSAVFCAAQAIILELSAFSSSLSKLDRIHRTLLITPCNYQSCTNLTLTYRPFFLTRCLTTHLICHISLHRAPQSPPFFCLLTNAKTHHQAACIILISAPSQNILEMAWREWGGRGWGLFEEGCTRAI